VILLTEHICHISGLVYDFGSLKQEKQQESTKSKRNEEKKVHMKINQIKAGAEPAESADRSIDCFICLFSLETVYLLYRRLKLSK